MHWPVTHPHVAPVVGQPAAGASQVELTPSSALHTSLEQPPTKQPLSAEQAFWNEVPSTRAYCG